MKSTKNWWVRPQQNKCVSNGVTAVLHWAIDIRLWGWLTLMKNMYVIGSVSSNVHGAFCGKNVVFMLNVVFYVGVWNFEWKGSIYWYLILFLSTGWGVSCFKEEIAVPYDFLICEQNQIVLNTFLSSITHTQYMPYEVVILVLLEHNKTYSACHCFTI